MQSTTSGDFREGLCSHCLVKFSEKLVTLVGVHASCRGNVGGHLEDLMYEINVRPATQATTSHSPHLLCHDIILLPSFEVCKVSTKNGIYRKQGLRESIPRGLSLFFVKTQASIFTT